MSIIKIKNERYLRRKARVRAKIYGTALKPRVSVFRSNRHFYAQLIDDVSGKTIASVSSLALVKTSKKPKQDLAKTLGGELAKKAAEKKIDQVVFDKGAYRYHGSVKAFCDALREGGIKV